MAKICCLGVCEGMTWDQAKDFIIKKHDLAFWKSWVNKVEWRDEGKWVKKENNTQGILFDTVLDEYEKCMVPPNPSIGKRKLQDFVNGDGVIHTGPGYLQWDLWDGNVELARRFCANQHGGKEMIWTKLGECWTYSYVGGGGRANEVQKFRDSLK